MDKNTLYSSFGKWVAPLNCLVLQQKVEEKRQDKYKKKLTTKAYLFLFLHAQVQQREGLRAIAEDPLLEEFQKELELESISYSQLSRKNNNVDTEILSEVCFDLVKQIKLKSSVSSSKFKDLKVVDSTTITLGMKKYQWATFRKTKAGVKVHLRLVFIDENTVYPEKIVVTPAGKNDRTQMEILVDEKDAMYVFDRGYIDYEKFDRYCDEGIFFASRLKKNAVVRVLHSFNVNEESLVLSDSMVVVGSPTKRMENVLRLVEVQDTKGNVIRIITNRFDIDPEEIGEIYRSRWAIELFFKWIKQHLKIKHFYGTSEKAVENQVYITLISYCLFVLIQVETNTRHTLYQLMTWLRILFWKPYEVWMSRIEKKTKRRKE